MQAAVLQAVKDVAIQEIDEPTCGAGEVLIDVKACGVCGSDVHVYRGFHPFRRPPVVLGHEAAGEVVEVGSSVTRVAVGDRVCIEPQITCGRCEQCVRGFSNFCVTALRPGMPGWGGFLAEQVVAPEDVLFKLTPETSYIAGAMVEPASVAYRAFRRGGVAMGARVAVLGVGAIGNVFARLCRLTDVGQMMVTDVKDYNLEFAASISDCIPVDARREDVIKAGMEITKGEGFDVIAITSGAERGLIDALNLCAPSGVVVLIAIYPNEIPFDGTRAVYREADVRASFCYTQKDFAAVTGLVNSGVLDLDAFVTHRVALGDAPRMFSKMDSGFDYIKVTFDLATAA